jgi:hypothetical protein
MASEWRQSGGNLAENCGFHGGFYGKNYLKGGGGERFKSNGFSTFSSNPTISHHSPQ